MAGTQIEVGDKLPDVTLRKVGPEGPEKIETSNFFKGRKVVLFSVLGAFTGTCSNEHVPSFLEHADEIRAKGVDEIACIAVNDAGVLDVWAKQLSAKERITFLSDGNGEFARATGMTLDASAFGFGERSQRYAAVVEDGVVKALEIEENPGACTVSGAPKILESL